MGRDERDNLDKLKNKGGIWMWKIKVMKALPYIVIGMAIVARFYVGGDGCTGPGS